MGYLRQPGGNFFKINLTDEGGGNQEILWTSYMLAPLPGDKPRCKCLSGCQRRCLPWQPQRPLPSARHSTFCAVVAPPKRFPFGPQKRYDVMLQCCIKKSLVLKFGAIGLLADEGTLRLPIGYSPNTQAQFSQPLTSILQLITVHVVI